MSGVVTTLLSLQSSTVTEKADIKASASSAFQVPEKRRRLDSVGSWGNQPLSVADKDVFDLIEKEKTRQWKGLELIASENFTSQAVLEALGSPLTNKYSEGYPGQRYYVGNHVIDEIETLCRERALQAFHLNPEQWGVNVQPYSCTSANFAVFTALLKPGDRIMGLDLPSGGHLSHGGQAPSGRKISATSIFFDTFPYKVDAQTGYVDFDRLEDRALDFKPRILICGGSAYPREWDYERFRQIADKCGAWLMCDMAHISGLVAAQECRNPFDYCDIVTSTTHKSLRGPRGGVIFFRRGVFRPGRRNGGCPPRPHLPDDGNPVMDLEYMINFSVFPTLQGGPHNTHTAALAVALKQVASPEYKAYMQQVKKNAKALAAALLKRDFKLVTGGTENHLLLWDLRPLEITGNRYEKVCELCSITVNKNAVSGDSNPKAPGCVRLGTPAMTSRGCQEADMERIVEFLVRAVSITQEVMKRVPGGGTQKDFIRCVERCPELIPLRADVERFSSAFDVPGFDVSTYRMQEREPEAAGR
eukprot:TRINITY_DN23327_c0_g1_i1.p1 TRINITY_DN23327_c0_g1~~TRINITY_DN23327_c0_g1_i1.p1  ORF type:complete len:531 (-),score=66.93 TRINITY_DN23327_c0_g1_i1:96-1688(-)